MLTPSAAPTSSFSASRSISIPARSPAIYASSCQRCWPYKCSHPILSPITHLHSFALGRLGCSRALAQLAHSLDQVAPDDLDARMLVIRADQVGVGERLALLVVARADRDLALPVAEHAVAPAEAGAAPLGDRQSVV